MSGDDADRLIEADALSAEDRELDVALRPRSLEEFVGQDRVKEQLAVLLEGARKRGEPVDHLLFSGPPGLGKTTLAQIVARELGAGFQPTSGPALERPSDVAAILTNLGEGDVLFVDEIHRMPRAVEEVLYPALEDFTLDIVLGKGATARSIRLDLPRFTFVGATTRPGRITRPLRERFGFSPRLDYYAVADLARAGLAGIGGTRRARPASWGSKRTTRGPGRSRGGRGARRGSRIVCSGACGTSRRSATTAGSPATSRGRGSRSSRWTRRAWIGSITRCCAS